MMRASEINFVILPPGEDAWPWTLAATIESAAAKLGALMLEDPAKWSAGGIMPYEAWNDAHEASWLNKPPAPITESEFFEMLGALPPLAWTKEGGLERFNMSEFTSGRITAQYGRYGGQHLHKYVRHGDRSTYLQPHHFARVAS